MFHCLMLQGPRFLKSAFIKLDASLFDRLKPEYVNIRGTVNAGACAVVTLATSGCL